MPELPPPIPDSYWLIPNRFLAGEYPGSKHPEDARAKLRLFLDAGVNHFIDLTTPADHLEPYAPLLNAEAASRGLTVAHQRFPITDLDIPSPEHMTRILDDIDAAVDAGHTVYVHCWGGHGRTGTAVGCYLVRHGMTGDQALDEVRRLHDTFADRHRRSPETGDQRSFVRTWSPAAAFKPR